MVRRIAAAVGVVVLAFGTLTFVAPGVATLLPIPTELVSPVGALVLLVGVYAAQQWRRAEHSSADPPTPETATEYPVPGEEVDDLLAIIDENYLAAFDQRRTVRRRLTALAVAVLADRGNWTERGAEAALEAGTWSDDPHAVAYFAGEYPEWAPLSLRLREQAPVVRVPHSRQVGRAVAEIRAVADGDVDLPETPPDPTERAPAVDGSERPGQEADAAATGGSP